MIKIIKKSRLVLLIIAIAWLGVAGFVFAQEVVDDTGLSVLNEQIQGKKDKVEELQDRVRELQQSINARRSEASSLENQLSILSQRVEQTKVEVEITNNKIEQTRLEVAQTQAEITQTEREIKDEKDKLAAMIRTLNKLDQKTAIEIMLVNENISDYFNQLQSLISLQDRLNQGIDDLKQQKLNLNGRVKNLKDKETTLAVYTEKLEVDQLRLEGQSTARAQLLSDTRNSEAKFQELLHEAKAEQIQINADIQTLEKVIRQKLAGQGQDALDKLGRGQMIYPVPFRGITAQFHDPDYPYRYIFEHPAIDLRAPQSTPIKAALPGFVARARDAGQGYSYVMLIHADGLSTVYGHVSKILVSEDEFVNQGDIIALSGGLPGTPGAGRLTTGPHLHFETRLDGIPVNPLNYLQ